MSTIAAISTAQGQGGIGVIRVSGEQAFTIVDKIFKSVSGKKIMDIKGYTALFGHIYNNEEVLDEAVVLKYVAPKSFTGENVVEISCHGGMYITKEVLNAVIMSGASLAEPGEFTKRAYLNGKMDLTEAESVMDIISAKSKSAARAALFVKDGALFKFERVGYNIDDLIKFQVNAIRKYKPYVVVGHDENGEYSHGQHILNSKSLDFELKALIIIINKNINEINKASIISNTTHLSYDENHQ